MTKTDREPLTIDQIPELPGYINVARVAAIFGFAKESILYKIYTQRAFTHVYKVGTADDGSRPILMLLESEVRRVKEQEDMQHEYEQLSKPLPVRLKEFHRRVKAWGRESGWTLTPIHPAGQPDVQLVTAYLDQHPEDPRPTE